MKRILIGILIGGFLTTFLFLLRPSLAGLARERHEASGSQDKTPTRWETVKDIKVLKLWEVPGLGPKVPQIAILQLSSERQIDLQRDPLAFYRTYGIFTPKESNEPRGHFVLRLLEPKVAGKDQVVVAVVHDADSYSGFASFEVEAIKP